MYDIDYLIEHLPEVKKEINCPSGGKKLRLWNMIDSAVELLIELKKLQEQYVNLDDRCNDMQSTIQEQLKALEQYHKADGFLTVHGWKW